MTPPAPLTDDWLYWDPAEVASFPHSREPLVWTPPPVQLDLFQAAARSAGSPLPEAKRDRIQMGSDPV